jgi:hypothetical protein
MYGPWLPAAALERWREIAGRSDVVDPVARVGAWFEWLTARMVCSGGRVGRLLIETGLCTPGELLACVRAQIDAGPVPANAVYHDIEADLWLMAELGPLFEVEALSERLAGEAWARAVDEVHEELATRLLAARRVEGVEVVLGRVRWHETMLTWLERHGAGLPRDVYARVVARAEEMVLATHLPREYHVDLYVRLAVLADEGWLERAREVLSELPAALVEATPDVAHPVESIAWALARLGDFAGAMAEIAGLGSEDKHAARLRLLPLAPDAARRAELVEGLIGGALAGELSWAWVVEAVPEIGERALAEMLAIADIDACAEQVGGAARYMRGEAARSACAWLLARAEGVVAGTAAWERAWEDALDAMTATGWEALLDDAGRRRLVDELLARPEIDLWREAGAFVPDDRVAAVLACAHAGMARADHYMERDRWSELALPLLRRAEPAQAEAWLAVAAPQMTRTGIDGAGLARLAAWSPTQQREIVAGRLGQHQREFLPGQIVHSWLLTLAWGLPRRLWPDWRGTIAVDVLARHEARGVEFAVVGAEAEAEAEALRGMLLALTERTGWPEGEQVLWVFAALGRCAGEAAITAAAAELVALRLRL